MLDIAELLKARKSEFLSLRELITRIKLQQPHVSESDIAEVIYLEMINNTLPEWAKRGIAGSIEQTDVDDSYEPDISLRRLLQVVFDLGAMPKVTPPPEPPMDLDDDIPF